MSPSKKLRSYFGRFGLAGTASRVFVIAIGFTATSASNVTERRKRNEATAGR
jgi:hypothetical protein